MTRTLPLFPLPGVVLLPETMLPLHIFEPRYRRMVEDALASDRTIGMAMLKPGFVSDDGGSPVHAIGGAGEIMESEKLEDGRYNILVQGRFRYRILDEERWPPAGGPGDVRASASRSGSAPSYRVARVEQLESLPFSSVEEAVRISTLATKLFEILQPEIELPPLPEERLAPERLASELALRLRYEPSELQRILETNSIPSRFTTLVARMIEWQKRIEFLAPFRPGELDVTRN